MENRTDITCPDCGRRKAADAALCWHCTNPTEAAEARARGGAVAGRRRRYASLLEAVVAPVPIVGLDDILKLVGENLAVLRSMDSTPAVANSITATLRLATDVLLARLDSETVEAEIAKLKTELGLT